MYEDSSHSGPDAPSTYSDEDGWDFIDEAAGRVAGMTRTERDQFKAVLLSRLAEAGADRDKACRELEISTRELRWLEEDDADFKHKVAEVLKADNYVLADYARKALKELVLDGSEATRKSIAVYLDKAYGTEGGKAKQVEVKTDSQNLNDIFGDEKEDTSGYDLSPAKGAKAQVHEIPQFKKAK